MDENRTDNRKRRILACVLMIGFLFLTVAGYMCHLRVGIKMGGKFLYRRSETEYSSRNDRFMLHHDGEQTTYELLVDGVSRTATIAWTGEKNTMGNRRVIVTFDNGDVVDAWWWEEVETFTDSDGLPDVQIIVGDPKYAPTNDKQIAGAIIRIDQGLTRRAGEPVLYFMGLFFYLLGALVLLFPMQLYKLGRLGRDLLYEDSTLTSFGESWVRFGSAVSGTVIIVISVLVVVRLLPPMQ